MYFIYLLSEPINLIPKYIGYSKNPKERYSNHLCVKKLKSIKNSWIKNLKEKGLKPEMIILDECSSFEEANILEIFWIDLFKSWGFILKNGTKGGSGKRPFPLKEETKKQISKTLKEKYQKENHKLKGVKWSEERKLEKSLQTIGKKPHSKLTFAGRKQNNRIKVIAFKDGQKLGEYECMLHAANDLQINVGTISNIKNGKSKSAKGYTFEFLLSNQ